MEIADRPLATLSRLLGARRKGKRERREKSEELITSRRQTCGGGRKRVLKHHIHNII